MSRSVSIQRCVVCELYTALLQIFGEFVSVERFEQILKTFGEVHAGMFYVLDNEYAEEYNSFQNLFSYLNRIYDLEDSFSVGLAVFKEGVAHVSLKEAFETLDKK